MKCTNEFCTVEATDFLSCPKCGEVSKQGEETVEAEFRNIEERTEAMLQNEQTWPLNFLPVKQRGAKRLAVVVSTGHPGSFILCRDQNAFNGFDTSVGEPATADQIMSEGWIVD